MHGKYNAKFNVGVCYFNINNSIKHNVHSLGCEKY
jgi:hypothetical protein